MSDAPSLVRPLEPRWQAVLDAVLRPMRRPELSTKDVARLAPEVKALSLAYNSGQAEGRRTKLPLEARIAFSFPRDVPKGAAAVRELVASGALTIPKDRPLRVLDLGAGLGAMTWGLARALEASGASGRVEALLVDEDEDVLERAAAIAREARGAFRDSPIELAVTTRRQSLSSAVDSPDAGFAARDVVILGQVLSEVDPRSDPAARIESHAALLANVLRTMVASDGALVVVEPALRDRTRHLHTVRDRLLEAGSATVFAPCLHAATCPMLAIDTEWCHEDLPVDLPSWVVPLARAAGLRWQGLTFSYLVLRKDGRAPVSRLGPGKTRVRFRAVSDLLRSKGKTELFVCGEDAERRRIRRLDRDAGLESGVSFLDLRRGDIVTLSSAAEDSARDGGPNPGPNLEVKTSSSDPPCAPIDERGRVAARVHGAIDVGAARK